MDPFLVAESASSGNVHYSSEMGLALLNFTKQDTMSKWYYNELTILSMA